MKRRDFLTGVAATVTTVTAGLAGIRDIETPRPRIRPSVRLLGADTACSALADIEHMEEKKLLAAVDAGDMAAVLSKASKLRSARRMSKHARQNYLQIFREEAQA